MNRTKLVILFSIVCLFVAMPLNFAMDNDTIIADDNVISNDFYFDASVENDTGDGSASNPYKLLTSDRITKDSNIYLADGEYELNSMVTANNVNVIGSNPQKTIISYHGVAFKLSGSLTLTNVTILYGAVNANGANLTATNTIFKSYSSSSLSPVMTTGGILEFDNCTFEDNSAYKGGAISMEGGQLLVNNSVFTGNNAKFNGGAIYCEKEAHAEIYNSRFENDESENYAGGAIYVLNSYMKLANSEISNCFATFGGAITALESEINLTNFKSKNNRAKYYGGSVYSLYHTFYIANSILINNSADEGGALFADSVESFNIFNNVFINNTAQSGSAVFSQCSDYYYDSIYDKVLNNTFENNAVYEADVLNITFENDDYILIRLNGDDTSELPSFYDLRDLNQVTSVKNQGKGGNCWAFSSLAALESAILKATNVTYDLSENNMKNLMSLYSSYGWTMDTNVGGYDKMAIGYLTSWLGPVNESDDAYDAYSLLSPSLVSLLHIQNIVFLTRDNYTDNDAIKYAIMNYGAVSTSIYWSDTKSNKNYYYNGNSGANHAVAIVGWDDNYSKNNFKTTPEGDGAWIIKNSWGADSTSDGFYYVSYYDTKIAQPGKYVSFAFVLNNTLKYDKIYQYDVQGKTDYFYNTTDTVWYKNRFTATADEYLAAVSTYFEKESKWDLSVYVNDVLKITKSGKTSPSYSTIDLDHLIELKKGDVFEIVFKISVDGDTGVPISEYISLNQVTYSENTSFISYDGKTWTDIYELEWSYPDHTYNSQVACIKAFTLSDKINTNIDIKVTYNRVNNVSTVVAYVYDEWGNAARDGTVIFTVEGNQYRSTVVNGKASFNYYMKSDSYAISAVFSGSDYYSSNAIQFTKPSKFEVDFEIADIEYGEDLMAYVHLYDEYGNTISDIVSLKIGSYTSDLTVGDEKYYKLPFSLNTGFYEAEIYGNNFDSRKVNFTISKLSAQLNLDVVTRYADAAITISLSSKINDAATLNFLGKNQTVRLINGKAVLDYKNLACANYTLSVYLPDYYYNSFKNASFTIDYRNTSLMASDIATYYMSGGELTIKLIDNDGNPVSGKEIEVTINGKTENCTTNNRGIAVYEVYMENGVYTVNLAFKGDDYYVPCEASSKVNVSTSVILISSLTKTYGSYYTFKLLDAVGNPLKNYDVSVEMNGINEFITSDSNGIFSLLIDEKAGSYKMVIINPANNEEISKTIKVVSRISGNSALTMYYGAGKSYTVRVFDDDGNIAKGVSVTFKVGSKTYTRTTNSNGYASLKIGLSPATYTITATYKGFKVSNKIVVKPTLILSTKTVKKSKTFKYTVKLLNTNGKILKNKKITVKFRGKTYKAKTNSKGIATFNVKALSKTGKFTLTASYGSAKISKTITIKK